MPFFEIKIFFPYKVVGRLTVRDSFPYYFYRTLHFHKKMDLDIDVSEFFTNVTDANKNGRLYVKIKLY